MRIFVIDTVCAQRKGHNLTALENHKNVFMDLTGGSHEVYCLGSKVLRETCAPDNLKEIVPFFEFCLFDVLPLTKHDGGEYQPVQFAYSTPIDPQHRIKINDPDLGKYYEFHKQMQEISDLDFERFFVEYNIGRDDIIYFPSADYYSAMSVMCSMLKRQVSQSPSVCLRFINVMEHWTTLSSQPFVDIVDKTNLLVADGYRVFLATESIGYSYYIAEMSKRTVFQLSYLPPGQQSLLPFSAKEKVVLFPGSQRIDKGIERIPSIVKEFIVRYNLIDVKFIVQFPGLHEMKALIHVYRQLSAWPMVEIQNTSISNSLMRNNHERAVCICMPYNQDTYSSLRSSGSLVESALYGRPLITTRCDGFASEIEFFKFGRVADDDESIAGAINFYIKEDPEVTFANMTQSLYRYRAFLLESYRSALRILAA